MYRVGKEERRKDNWNLLDKEVYMSRHRGTDDHGVFLGQCELLDWQKTWSKAMEIRAAWFRWGNKDDALIPTKTAKSGLGIISAKQKWLLCNPFLTYPCYSLLSWIKELNILGKNLAHFFLNFHIKHCFISDKWR